MGGVESAPPSPAPPPVKKEKKEKAPSAAEKAVGQNYFRPALHSVNDIIDVVRVVASVIDRILVPRFSVY